MPKFSIIVPIYNVEKYLNRCIASIFKQGFADYELILIDDGSPDNCGKLCDEYAKKDARVKVIHKKNAGVSMARQDGIDLSEGEYLVFVDADDWITDDCLETLSHHTDVDLIRFGAYVEKPDGTYIEGFPLEKGYYSKQDIVKNIFPGLIQNFSGGYYCPSLWQHAFKRDLFIENMTRDAVIKIGEDGACVMPCVYHANSMYFLDRCMYYYCYNDSSATKGGKVFPWTDPMMVAKHLEEKIDMSEFDFREQLDRKITHELFSVVVSQFNRKESYAEIKKDILHQLDLDIYKSAISRAVFKNSAKAKLMSYALKYRQLWLIKLYSKIR